MKDKVLALAEELDGVSFKENCDQCLACGTALCRGDMECAESVHKACAKRLRAIVEHEAEDVTTVSAYDLLPDEDREAIAWVREYGGLEAVKASIHQGAMGHGCLLKVAEMLGTSIYDGTDNADALLDKLEKRFMPEGMEWPRFEDGELAKFGDEHENGKGNASPLNRVCFYLDGTAILGRGQTKVRLAPGKRVKRPAPKVLDADGVEIRVGDEVYIASYGDGPWTVTKITTAHAWHVYGHSDELGSLDMQPNLLTHRAPVLAADGEPLEVGQTVYDVEDGKTHHVTEVDAVSKRFRSMEQIDGSHWLDPMLFTHQRPVLDADGVPIREGDTVWLTGESEYSWTVTDVSERHVGGYCNENGSSLDMHSKSLTHAKPDLDTWERIERGIERGKTYTDELVLSIVRRCRALAERGE